MPSDTWLFNCSALQEYILLCCQDPRGGLIDKPGKSRDFYHTCYTLSGMSVAQNFNWGKNCQGQKYVMGARFKDNEMVSGYDGVMFFICVKETNVFYIIFFCKGLFRVSLKSLNWIHTLKCGTCGVPCIFQNVVQKFSKA